MLGMNAQTLRRWLVGYKHGRDGNQQYEKPLWKPQYPSDDEGGVLLGFRDLIQARMINKLRLKRIGLPTIRICIERAREIVNQDHPFSTPRFKTDGKSIFLEITKQLEEPMLIDLKRRQGVFNSVVAPSLADVDFGQDGADRWWLLPGKKSIVADPKRAFGQPILAERGVTTVRIAQVVKAEGSIETVCRLYDVTSRAVKDALAYERQYGCKQAA